MTPRVADGLLSKATVACDPTPSPISERETDVLRLIAVGHSNKEVAAQLKISVKTVEVHKANAMKKLGLAGRVISSGMACCRAGSTTPSEASPPRTTEVVAPPR